MPDGIFYPVRTVTVSLAVMTLASGFREASNAEVGLSIWLPVAVTLRLGLQALTGWFFAFTRRIT